MMNNGFSNAERAQILVEALPYIEKYRGEAVVIKYGGNAMINEQLRQQVMEDIVLLHLIGVKVVLVHGGGPEISELMDKLGKKTEFVNGLRVTDAETAEIQMPNPWQLEEMRKALPNLLQQLRQQLHNSNISIRLTQAEYDALEQVQSRKLVKQQQKKT